MAKFNDMQEILDFVIPKVLAQGKKAYSNFMCVYNGPDDTHCAIGWCNDFGHYNGSVDGMRRTMPEKLDETFGPNVPEKFLRNLQASHDHIGSVVAIDGDLFVEGFRENIRWLTTEWELEYRETWG